MRTATPRAEARRRLLPWRIQALVLLLVLVMAVLAVSLAAALYVVRTGAEEDAKARALSVAQTVASDPRYAEWVTSGPPSEAGPVQVAAEAVRVHTGSLAVVITDAQGVRYSHPHPDNVGDPVSTDPSEPLAGREYVGIDRGTLGVAARGKVPLRNASGAIVGTVSVGLPIADVDESQRRFSQILFVGGGIALVAGLVGVFAFWRRLESATHGLEPEEMADLLREHAAVLGGALDGVVALDAEGRVRICNDAARRYLASDVALGRPASESGLPASVLDLPPGDAGRLVVAGGRVLDLRRVPVERGGRDLGVVVVLRDRTDLDDLGRELEATRVLTDALRAQTHEHANRMHALSGMLQLGHVAEARDYLTDLSGAVAWDGAVADPYLSGLLSAKAAAASEQGVELRVTEETWVSGRLNRPLDSVTVVGNLIDNAIRAAASGQRRPALVEVSLLAHDGDMLVHVVDSGDGVRPGDEAAVFADGWTTKADGASHGVGLALARVTARRHGGDVTLEQASGDDHGAVFTARLAGVLNDGGRRA